VSGVIGVGIDVVPVARFAESLTRTAGLADRLFTAAEQLTPAGRPRTAESLAGRFAAKEALAKALGAPGSLRWHDAVVEVDPRGAPRFELSGTVAARAEELGIGRVHLSMSHDGGMAAATVIAEA